MLSSSPSRDICFVKIITDEKCTGYFQPGHPERPQRITTTVELLKSQTDLPIEWLAPTKVSDEQVLRAHSPEVLTRLKIPQAFDADTPFFENIFDFAHASVAAALEAMRRVGMKPVPPRHLAHDRGIPPRRLDEDIPRLLGDHRVITAHYASQSHRPLRIADGKVFRSELALDAIDELDDLHARGFLNKSWRHD